MVKQKRLQENSILDDYDLDGDNEISNDEIEQVRQIKETETKLRKNLAQLRMARYTLIFMGLYALLLASPLITLERLEKLSAITDLLFLSGSSIVGFYMGSTAYMSKNGK